MRDINTPPSWCPDAIPSDRGWRHPVTGELLVSVRGGVKPKTELLKKQITEVLSVKEVIPETTEKIKVIDENVKNSENGILEKKSKTKKNNFLNEKVKIFGGKLKNANE